MKRNLLFGHRASGLVTRTLERWEVLLTEASWLIEGLRSDATELFKSRAETQKALAEREKTEDERLQAALKLDQTLAKLKLDGARNVLNAS